MVRVAPMDSSPMPCLPANRAPVGEATAATANGTPPSEYGASCSLALCSSCVGVLALTVSPPPRQHPAQDVEIGFHQLTGVGGCQPDHRRVAGQRAGAPPADHATVG